MKVGDVRFVVQKLDGTYHYDTDYGRPVPFGEYSHARNAIEWKSRTDDSFKGARVVPVALATATLGVTNPSL